MQIHELTRGLPAEPATQAAPTSPLASDFGATLDARLRDEPDGSQNSSADPRSEQAETGPEADVGDSSAAWTVNTAADVHGADVIQLALASGRGGSADTAEPAGAADATTLPLRTPEASQRPTIAIPESQELASGTTASRVAPDHGGDGAEARPPIRAGLHPSDAPQPLIAASTKAASEHALAAANANLRPEPEGQGAPATRLQRAGAPASAALGAQSTRGVAADARALPPDPPETAGSEFPYRSNLRRAPFDASVALEPDTRLEPAPRAGGELLAPGPLPTGAGAPTATTQPSDTAPAAHPAAQLPRHLEILATRGGGAARIRLDPPHLGEVDIRVSIRGSAVEVVIRAEEPSAQAAVMAHREQLIDALSNRDLRVQSLEILGPGRTRTEAASSGQSPFPGAASGGFEGGSGRNGRHPDASGTTTSLADRSARDFATRATVPRTLQGVDVRI